ncbi:hypothetical protein [Sphingomonas sp. Marseille-Q8236]
MGFRRGLFAFLRRDGSPIGLDRLPAAYRQVGQVPMFLFYLSLAELVSPDLSLRQRRAQMRDLRLEFLSGHRIQGRFRCWHRMIIIAIHISGDGGTAIEKNVTDRGINPWLPEQMQLQFGLSRHVDQFANLIDGDRQDDKSVLHDVLVAGRNERCIRCGTACRCPTSGLGGRLPDHPCRTHAAHELDERLQLEPDQWNFYASVS